MLLQHFHYSECLNVLRKAGLGQFPVVHPGLCVQWKGCCSPLLPLSVCLRYYNFFLQLLLKNESIDQKISCLFLLKPYFNDHCCAETKVKISSVPSVFYISIHLLSKCPSPPSVPHIFRNHNIICAIFFKLLILITASLSLSLSYSLQLRFSV